MFWGTIPTIYNTDEPKSEPISEPKSEPISEPINFYISLKDETKINHLQYKRNEHINYNFNIFNDKITSTYVLWRAIDKVDKKKFDFKKV